MHTENNLWRYHLSGWEPLDPAFAVHATDYKSYLDSYCNLAAELQINIVPGTIVEAHPSPSCPESCSLCPKSQATAPRLLNIAYFISATGAILGSYQKANLWYDERSHLSSIPSTTSPHEVITTPIGPVGLLICWDLAFPEGFRALVEKGAKIIIVPAFWTGLGSAPTGLERNPGFEKMTMQSLLVARSFENTAAVVFVNVGGDIKSGNLGISQVTMPFLGSVGTPLDGGEGMAVVGLDMDILKDAEQIYRIREDMAGDGWRYQK
jgi:predicted amidohydrolase